MRRDLMQGPSFESAPLFGGETLFILFTG